MIFWQNFWFVALMFAGVAFLVIEVVVIIKGSKELLSMILELKNAKKKLD